eukprot:3561361-Ditylum_brightwellii.AAC.1
MPAIPQEVGLELESPYMQKRHAIPINPKLPSQRHLRNTNNTATIETDGSIKDRKGSYAVVFQASEEALSFTGPADCHPDLISSYQAELLAILASPMLAG